MKSKVVGGCILLVAWATVSYLWYNHKDTILRTDSFCDPKGYQGGIMDCILGGGLFCLLFALFFIMFKNELSRVASYPTPDKTIFGFSVDTIALSRWWLCYALWVVGSIVLTVSVGLKCSNMHNNFGELIFASQHLIDIVYLALLKSTVVLVLPILLIPYKGVQNA